MRGRALIEHLRSSKRVYGTLTVSTSPEFTKVAPDMGLDYIFIDTEHIPIDRETLGWMCRTYRAMNVAPLVRVPEPDPVKASMVLDGGADGVIVPYVETVEQVLEMAGAVKYQPLKGKKLESFLGKRENFSFELETYLERANEGKVLIINIESLPGIEALPEILKVKELDAVLIGPHDLSCSLGVPEDYQHPDYRGAVEQIIHSVSQAGKGVGIHMVYDGALEEEIRWMKMGANLILYSADLIEYRRGITKALNDRRTAMGDDQGQSGQDSITI